MDKEDQQSGNSDILVKYQKLATEYAKIRSQLNVLKRGIIDEQNRTTILKDELNERDKMIRKYEQEIDSYSFRNQQLEKRVTILQEDLTEKEKKGKKQSAAESRKHEQTQLESTANSISLNELLTKIDENVQLSRKISQQEDSFKNEISDLANSYENKLKESSKHYRGLIVELETEKSSLHRSLEVACDDVKNAAGQISDLHEKIKNLTSGKGLIEIDIDGERSQTIINDSWRTETVENSSCELIGKLVKSQQETEYWKLEYELNKMKHRKTLLKFEKCKKHLTSLGREDLLVEVNEVTTPDNIVTTIIGKMEITPIIDTHLNTSDEKELTDYFTQRINELIHLLQLCDRKAITFYDECTALQANLILAVEDRNRLQETFNELQSKYGTLYEELQLITNTYETQHQTLTEHIGNMNDKLTAQTDTIEHLERQIKLGSKKK